MNPYLEIPNRVWVNNHVNDGKRAKSTVAKGRQVGRDEGEIRGVYAHAERLHVHMSVSIQNKCAEGYNGQLFEKIPLMYSQEREFRGLSLNFLIYVSVITDT